MAASQKVSVTVGRRRLQLSNLDKVMYPGAGFTKGQVIDYYRGVSPVLLPHLRNRPLTMKRYPDGVGGASFYEKECPGHRPEWVSTVGIWTSSRKRDLDYCLVNDLPTLVWVANLAALELHTSLASTPALDRPTTMVFDLDPGPPAGAAECCRVALRLRELLAGAGLESHPKTSGSKGVQVYVPLNSRVSFDQTKAFAHAAALRLSAEHPQEIVSEQTKSLRRGKVLIDWSQNDEHKTTVCVYSLRARERPTVSTPVDWEEVAAGQKDPSRLALEAPDVLSRVERGGDLFQSVLTRTQRLPDPETLSAATGEALEREPSARD